MYLKDERRVVRITYLLRRTQGLQPIRYKNLPQELYNIHAGVLE